jgi:hypothetical protein
MMPNNPAADPHELRQSIASGGQVRLVNNQWTGKLEAVAFLRPGAWHWQEIPVEGPAERVIRETVVNLATQWVEQLLPGIAPPTSMDQALSITATAVKDMSLQDIAGKTANIAGQALACHVGCVAVARQVGAVLQTVVASMPFPASTPAEALNAATAGVVAFDLHDARLTAAVMNFFVGEVAPKVSGPAIPGSSAWAIQADQQSSRGGLPEPGDPAPPSPTTSRARHLTPSSNQRRYPVRAGGSRIETPESPRTGRPLPGFDANGGHRRGPASKP